MGQFVGAYDVVSKLSGHVYDVRFSQMWKAIATRPAETIDAKFTVDGIGGIVGLADPAFVEFGAKAGRDLTDREASFAAAEYLRQRLEEEDEGRFYDVTTEEVSRLIEQV